MMNKVVASFLFFCLPLVGEVLQLPQPRNEEEALAIRRIVGLWRDNDYFFAQTEIKTYLTANPKNPYVDYFKVMLGDMAMERGEYDEAFHYYEEIGDSSLKKHVQLKKWQSLYARGLYAQLYKETANYRENLCGDEAHFYYAEGALREALTLSHSPEKEEEKIALCSEAAAAYSKLLECEPFKKYAMLGLAEVHRLMGRLQLAEALYFDLAENAEEAEILFHVAMALLQSNETGGVEKGGEIFKYLATQGGKYSSEGSYQRLLYLAARQEWDKLMQERQLLLSHLEADHLPMAYFYFGMLNGERQALEQALDDLANCVGQGLPPQHEKKALIALLRVACALQRWNICEETFLIIGKEFPDTVAEASFILASSYHKLGMEQEAIRTYDRMITDFPFTPYLEKAVMGKVALLIEQKKYREAREILLEYIEIPSSSSAEMMRLAIQMSLAQLDDRESYSQLAADIERGLQAKIFDDQEESEKKNLLARAYVKLNRPAEALKLLSELATADPFLYAQCYIKKGNSPHQVIEYGEKALALYPEEKGLHLHLFNAYREVGEEEESTYQAAQHLNKVINLYPISLENRLWLAHYFAAQQDEQAIPILESLVESEANIKRFDREALLLASFYKNRENNELAEQLVRKVIDLGQSSQTQAKLQLAAIVAATHRIGEAKTLYEQLDNVEPIEVAYKAKLELARLDFAEAPEKNLKQLRELAVRKNLATEPIHLEAALDYAEFKASTYPEKERPHQLLELFYQIKAAFTEQDDICSKDYHACRQGAPEKERIYQAYMRYLDARIFLLQARLNPYDSGETKVKAACALFTTLRQGKYAVSDYLKTRAVPELYK